MSKKKDPQSFDNCITIQIQAVKNNAVITLAKIKQLHEKRKPEYWLIDGTTKYTFYTPLQMQRNIARILKTYPQREGKLKLSPNYKV